MWAASLLALAHGLLQAAPVAPSVRAEIDGLMAAMQASNCQFNRNGSWYEAAEAKAHLLRKLEYLEGKDMVKTTEQFIERAASTSSSSGKPYLVRCGGAAAQASQPWLSAQLQLLRAKPAAGR
ncbi:DUF5329 domain-containing protein [Paucibacter sp. APW11]|uniref:DUF5329 domain-containing protein n=1 Tax=Roseateles aquae TaxID=3077235 RepID=A0ABU3P8U1_9BURK|nr:DUF5329 domain-containing protein [Paucibacter sp. APW11]MDT8998987.1 DUF5329 domain-containing protein [Paucibacter sp. APW11]